MKEMKRILALVLCFVMLVGYVPVNAFATETASTEVTSEPTEAPVMPVQETSEPTEAPTENPEESTEGTTAPSEEPTEGTIAPTVMETEAATEATETETEETTAPTEAAKKVVRKKTSVSKKAATGNTDTATVSNDTTDYLFLATDRHANTSIIGTMINNMEAKIGENELDYLGLGGDMVGSGGTHPSYSSSTVLEEVTGATSSLSAANVDIVAGIHDMNVNDDAGIVLPYSGGGAQIFEGDRFYVYGVPESCISGAVSGVTPSTEADKFVTWASNVADKSKVIIVLSHYPLHQRRNDNTYAYEWAEALNTVAVGDDTTIDRDVAFFWGHNHTEESAADTAVYHVAPTGSISVQGCSSSQTIYFTYANAGYLKANSSATLVSITDTAIKFEKYKSSSVSTTNTVTRVKEAVTLSSIAVTTQPTKTTYTVGETLDTAGMVVTATYSGGTASAVTDYTVSDVDMNTAGTKTVTVTYKDKTATFEITVNAAVTENTWSSEDTFAAVTAKATGATFTEVYEDDRADALLSFWFGYDISLEGQVEGTSATVKLWLDPEFMTSENLAVYHLNETTGEYEAVSGYTSGKTEDDVEYITIANAALGTYVYGTPTTDDEIPAAAVLDSITIEEPTEPIKTKYFDTDVREITENGETRKVIAVDISGMVVKANYVLDGTAYSKTIEWNEFGAVADGYALTHDPLVDENGQVLFGEKTVTLTYGGKTATYTIWVCKENETVDGVTVSFDSPSVVSLAIEKPEEVSETITTAVAEKLTGTLTVYDITAQYANGDTALSGTATVTLPVSGLTNPAVYYVSDAGETERMKVTGKTETTVTFETTHFSKFVVGEGTEIEVPDPETATGSGNVTTTTKKTIYKLVSSLTAGEEYLIVSRNSYGDGYGLAASTSGVSVTVKAADSTSSVAYIEDKGDALEWTAETGWKFTSGSNELGISSSRLAFSTDSSWTFNDNQLYSRSNSNNYYLACSNGTWSVSNRSTSSRYAYFYKKTEVDVETPTTVSGTYSIAGKNISKVVETGTTATATLSSTLTFTPDDTTKAPADTDVSSEATYAEVTGGDPNGVITNIANGVVTFSGSYGKALVKVSYDTNGTEVAGGVVTNYITVEAIAPYYKIEITQGVTSDSGTTYTVVPSGAIIAKKQVTSATTLLLGTDGGLKLIDDAILTDDTVDASAYKLVWSSSNTDIATVDQSGKVTFKDIDKNGTTLITVTAYAVDDSGKATNQILAKDTITVTASPNKYYTTDDGKEQMPDYPGDGAVVIDKNATAVGNFNQTGIAQVELNMFGTPITIGKDLDVYIMVDMTSSMQSTSNGDRVTPAKSATKLLVKELVMNGTSYNKNNITVWTFDSGSSLTATGNSPTMHEIIAFGTIDNETEYKAAIDAIESDMKKGSTSGSTSYADSLKQVQALMDANKTSGRQQVVIYVSDGGATEYQVTSNATVSDSNIIGWFDDNYTEFPEDEFRAEYYTNEMKGDGVLVFTVGISLDQKQNGSYGNIETAESQFVVEQLLERMSSEWLYKGAYTAADADEWYENTDKTQFFYSVNSTNLETDLKDAFDSISKTVKAAASNVEVQDIVTDDYNVIFAKPDDVSASNLPNGQDFYIEVLKYPLNDHHDRTGETSSVQKVYIVESDGKYLVSTSANASGALTEITDETAALTDEQVYYYNNTDLTKLRFKTKHFEYNAAYTYTDENGKTVTTAKFTWNTAELSDDYDIALRYFVYLDGALAENSTVEAGPYPTNVEATVAYTNHLGNPCIKEFPVPQMTWNGAQVSYVFYLVDDNGNPINQSGDKVDFRAAVFVTDVFTQHVTWNDTEGITSLKVNTIAADKLPDGYTLFDPSAVYNLHVYQTTRYYKIVDGEKVYTETNEEGTIAEANWFEIVAGDGLANEKTTKVYSTLGGTRYDEEGVYTDTEKVTEVSYTYKDINGNEVEDTKKINKPVVTGIDFYDTTVAFAVKWTPKMMDDTVVVDYGLPVEINVVRNDLLENQIHGVGLAAPAKTNAVYDVSNLTTQLEKKDTDTNETDYTVSVSGANTLTFTQHDMTFKEPAEFYYDSQVSYTQSGVPKAGFMCAKVTVIPATTVYYEDEFVDLKTVTVKYVQATTEVTADNFANGTYYIFSNGAYTKAMKFVADTTYFVQDGTTTTEGWDANSVAATATQDQDRPGASKISEDLDADNNYGFDSAYTNMSQYSMGSAAMTNVTAGKYATAEFEFYGTGFDIISLTSATTGNIVINVYNDGETTPYVSETVNTYYGYERQYWNVTYKYVNGEWTKTNETKVESLGAVNKAPENPEEDATYTTCETRWATTASDNSNALYQIPVMKIGDGKTTDGLPYGKYKVVITATYIPFMDHNKKDTGYNFYLDAIRIYNPTGNQNATANDAYVKDGEAYPEYTELRDQIIEAAKFNSLTNDTTVSGIVFIDGAIANPTIKEYTSYGPNNELYLAAGQAVAGYLNAGNAKSVQLAIKTVGGTGKVEVYGVDSEGKTVACLSETISTATDMYYDITALNGKTLVVKNTGDVIISITNIKSTYGSAPVYPVSLSDVNTAADGTVTAKVTYSDNTSATVEEVVEASEKNEDGSVTYTYTYTEKVNTLTYTVSTSKTVAADSGVTTASETSNSTFTTKSLLSVNRSSVNSALATMSVEEDTTPETTKPAETETTEPSESETTEPEVSKSETTVPEETEPEDNRNQVQETVKEVVKNVINTVKNTLKNLFSKWFR